MRQKKYIDFLVTEIEKVTRLKTGTAAMKAQAHYYFDLLWKQGFMTRNEAYKWLANNLDCLEFEAHISSMDRNTLIKTIYTCIYFVEDLK